jgi:uncharacterized protein YeaO (DUF488 family)
MIFTCNFANWEKIPIPVTPISIALYPPKGWSWRSYKPLFPSKELLEAYKGGKIDDRMYEKSYTLQVLSLLKTHDVVEDLYNLKYEGTSGIALLCYENSDKFCHRHLVREWLQADKFRVREFEVRIPLKTSLGLLRKKDDKDCILQ